METETPAHWGERERERLRPPGRGCHGRALGGLCALPRQRTHYSRITYVVPADFPYRLEQFKEESGLSWSEISRRLGTYHHTVWRWWKGGVLPHPKLLARVLVGQGVGRVRPNVVHLRDGPSPGGVALPLVGDAVGDHRGAVGIDEAAESDAQRRRHAERFPCVDSPRSRGAGGVGEAVDVKIHRAG